MLSKSHLKISFLLPVILCGMMLLSFLFIPEPANASTEGNKGSTDICCPDEFIKPLKRTTPETTGVEVENIQIGLNKSGYYAGPISGVYDQTTEKAVKRFQKDMGLKSDGIAGSKTWIALINLFEASDANTKEDIKPKGNVEIVINTDKRKLYVYDGGTIIKEFTVAVGTEETPSPVGEWTIIKKSKNWGTGFGTRWLGLDVTWGIYGIHGTNKPWSIGGFESHGCFRMFNRDVEQLYEWVKIGTKVRVEGTVYSPFYEQRNKVHKGHKGAVVVLVQKGLIAEGYLKEKPDGNFGQSTEDALKKLQKDRGFEVTGQVDVDIWPVLGL